MKIATQLFIFYILICLNGLPVTYLRKISSGNGKVYVFEDNPVTWSMADTSCKNTGGTLAMIHSYDEHLFIKSVLDNFPMNIQKYKIGGRKDNNGHWVWNDGRPVHHKYWAPDEPNNAGQKENCLEYFLKGPGYLWNDRTCTDIGGYVCQSMCFRSTPFPTGRSRGAEWTGEMRIRTP
eukprot:XP_019918465.1 PREDICTED: type-2 ice-structuring protein-like [Crassostrea gigas]